MGRFFCFWWRCAKAAAGESVARANAWAPFVGALVLWLVLWSMGWEIIIPDKVPGGIIVGLAFLGVAWLIIFVFRALFIQPALLFQRETERADLAETNLDLLLQNRANLELLIGSTVPYFRRDNGIILWRFGVLNRGPAVAENVRVQLWNVRPEPTPAGGNLILPLTLSHPNQLKLNPTTQEIFEIFNAYLERQESEKGCWRARWLNLNIGYIPEIFLDTGGRWEMDYHVTASNADELSFTLGVSADLDGISVIRQLSPVIAASADTKV